MVSSRTSSWVLALLCSVGCGSAPYDVVSGVPLGSELTNLDRHLVRGAGSEGVVTQWVPYDVNYPSKADPLVNDFGKYRTVDLGHYDDWRRSKEFNPQFKGEILFFHHGWTSSDLNSLVYRDGKLVKKDWGFLPG